MQATKGKKGESIIVYELATGEYAHGKLMQPINALYWIANVYGETWIVSYSRKNGEWEGGKQA